MLLITSLAKQFLLHKDASEMSNLLLGLFTQQELEQLALRLEIVKKLKKGETQRKIAEDLKVGVATVTRGSSELKRGRFKKI